jgi:hypothetical protein
MAAWQPGQEHRGARAAAGGDGNRISRRWMSPFRFVLIRLIVTLMDLKCA